MNVQALGNGAKAVGSVNVATVLHVVLHTPAELLRIIGGVFPIVIPEIIQVVDVGTFSTEHLAKHAGLGHLECVEFVVVIAAVLQNHTVLAGFLREVDEVPALFKVHGRRHFDSGMLAVFKSALGYGEVVVPVGGYVNEVNVRTLADFFITFLAGIDGSGCQTGFLQISLTGFCTGFFIVAKGYNLYAGDMAETVDGTRATHAQTNESYANGLDFGSGQIDYIQLSGRTFGSFNYNGSLVPTPFGRRRERLCIHYVST